MATPNIRSGEANRLAAQAAYRGHIPGPPGQRPGGLSYALVRQPDGRLPLALTRVGEIDVGTRMTWRRAGVPHDELRCVCAAGGQHHPAEAHPVVATAPEQLRERATRYKALIE